MMTNTPPFVRGRRLALFTSAGIAALAISTPAFAQDADETISDEQAEAAPQADNAIVVTGSRIRRPNRDTLEPSIVVNADQIEERGLTNVGEVLNEQPAFGPPASSAVGGQSGSFGSGQSFINFFGLGSQRTLTLVNSRRYVSSNTASIFGPVAAGSQVDLNTIPTLMVDRLETIAVGGAPIYGADAIAGTVNIILKDRFEGVRFDAQMGIAEEGDAQEYRLGAMVGTSFADGRGNVVAAVEYNKTEGLLYTDRERTAEGLFYAAPNDPNSPFDNVIISDRRIPILSEFGAPTIVVNNAAITRDTLLMRMGEADWQDVIDANLTGVFRVSKAVLRGMMKAKGGRIVNVASVVGLMGNAGQTNYSAAKAGLLGFTRSLAREVGSRQITVNAIAPGFIETDMTRELDDNTRSAMLEQIPLQRLGGVDDIAESVAFLVSPAAAYITGETLSVNGGLYMGA